MSSRLVASPPLAWQGSLLGGGEPACDPAFASARRVELGQGAWVDVVPGWLSGADTLFAELVDSVPWQAHEVPMYERVVPQPRLSAWWGQANDRPWPARLAPLADALSGRYGQPFGGLGANLYRDGADSVAWHGDRVYRDQLTALVAVLTLGATRRFLLRPTGGGASVRFEPAAGDLLVMGGTCQRTWQHSVPKTTRAIGPRLSVTMRPANRPPPAPGQAEAPTEPQAMA